MQIIFKRRLTNELLTTYLPSFFLLGICYSTIHFKPFYFEAVVTVNLTVMLVATTLFVRFFELIVLKGHTYSNFVASWRSFHQLHTLDWLTFGLLPHNLFRFYSQLLQHVLSFMRKIILKSIIMAKEGIIFPFL